MPWFRFRQILGILTALLVFTLLLSRPVFLGQPWAGYLTFALMMVFASSFFKINKIFPIVFIVSFLPFIILYRGDIYLMYIVGFLAIILLYQIVTALTQLSRQSFLYWVLLGGVVLGVLDQGMNLPTISLVSKRINQLNTNLVHSMATKFVLQINRKSCF